MDALTLTLPEPPSSNRWWRMVNGRMVTSREAREYKLTVRAHVLASLLQTGRRLPVAAAPAPVSVTIAWFRSRKSGDLDKRLGVLLDALQGVAFDNDAQVVELHAARFDDPTNPRVCVEVRAVTTPLEGRA